MKTIFSLLVIPALLFGCLQLKKDNEKISLYIIGDSTVKNGSGDGENGLWGWGDFLSMYFDTSRVKVENMAMGGTSSRTFRDKGLWKPVYDKLTPGDYVLIQFGHNDGGPINDNFRARGTIKGIGEETEEIDNMLTGKHEIVHSYGWYIRQYIRETKEKGAIPVVFSPIPRNDWIEGKVRRNNDSYGKWAREVSDEEGAFFIDLNNVVADKYEEMGPEKVQNFFPVDHTHTNAAGARLNALIVAKEIQALKNCPLGNCVMRTRMNNEIGN